MQPYDACRLIAVNLYSFVDNPFTDKAKFNFKKFYEINYEAMRLSDDLIDLEIEHIDRILDKIVKDPEDAEIKTREHSLWIKIKETALSSRRTGLGFTALGDTLAALGLKYDSDEALEVIEKIMSKKMESELDCTIDLSILRGSFKGWDKDKEWVPSGEGIKGGNNFYENLSEIYPAQFNKMYKYGRRNLSFNTVAPTGSVSILTQTTSGIEPLFQPFYMRRKKINPGEEGVRVDFIDDSGDSWQEFPVLHPKFKEWIYVNYEEPYRKVDLYSQEELQDRFEQSPWYKSTANDIDWIKRVEIQSIIQKYITHSISSTINLPETVSYREVSDIYLSAWKKDLKGITVYVDGSRSGVLVTNKDNTELNTFNDHHAPTRPKHMEAKLLRFNNNKEKWIAFVGLLDEKPYEIFTGKLDDIKIPMKVEEGKITKVKDEQGNKSYNFDYDGGIVEDINKVFDNDFWNYGKLVSGSLRHGMPLHYVVEMVGDLKFSEDHINTWRNGVVRALKKFIPDGKVEGMKCSDCGSTDVIFEEGCSRCLSCGSSKCS